MTNNHASEKADKIGLLQKIKFRRDRETIAVISQGADKSSGFLTRKASKMGYQTILLTPTPKSREWWDAHRVLEADYTGGSNEAERVGKQIADYRITAILAGYRESVLPFWRDLHPYCNLSEPSQRAVTASVDKFQAFQWLGDLANSGMWDCAQDSCGLNQHPGPIVLKPKSGTGSAGIYFFDNGKEAADFLQRKDVEERDYIAQEIAGGYQYDIEGITVNGRHYVYAMIWEHFINRISQTRPLIFYFNPPMQEALRHQLETYTHQILDAWQVTNGPWHVEVRVDEEGIIRWLDFGNRLGNTFWDPISFVSNRDFLADLIHSETETRHPEKLEKTNRGRVRVFFESMEDGTYWQEKIKSSKANFQVETFTLEPFPHSTGNFQGMMILSSEDTDVLYQWFSLHKEKWLLQKQK